MNRKSLSLFIFVTVLEVVLPYNFGENESDKMYMDQEIKNMTIPEIIAFYKYPIEIQPITTEDGYILDFHRIPNPGKPPILLGHGFVSTSSEFVLAGPKHALSFLLFDQGYDVWMINFRGNRYSRKHKTLNPDKDKEYWKFSMHEHGIYDLKTGIDHVLNQTKFEKLTYIGYASGTTNFFVLMAEHPEIEQKVNLMVALAPLMFVGNVKGRLLQLALKNLDLLEMVFGFQTEFLPWRPTNVLGSAFRPLLVHILSDLSGPDPDLFQKNFLNVLAGHSPSGTSFQEAKHIGQFYRSGSFQKFDFGPVENLRRYKSLTPPKYNTRKNKIPKVLFYAKNDYNVGEKDVERIPKEISYLVEMNYISEDNFNHFGFILSDKAKPLVYDHIFELLKNFVK